MRPGFAASAGPVTALRGEPAANPSGTLRLTIQSRGTGPRCGPVPLTQALGGLGNPRMSFRIEHAESERKPFGDIRYRIFDGHRLVAHYRHDFRGDDHGFEFLDGTRDDNPDGHMIDFLEGGGPEPLRLFDRAVAYLIKRLWK